MIYKCADLLLKNANVITMEDDLPLAEAVAICDNKILYVGNEEEALMLCDSKTEIIDLNGKTVIPGLIENHNHPMEYAEQFVFVNLSGEVTKSKATVLKAISDKAQLTSPGEWLYGAGFDQMKFKEGYDYPSLNELDMAAPNNPLYVKRTCGHVALINSLAMKISGINRDTLIPEGAKIYKDEKGDPCGVISGPIKGRVPQKLLSDSEYFDNFVKYVQPEYLKKGITTTADSASISRYNSTWQKLYVNGNLKLRVRLWPMGRQLSMYERMLDHMVNLGIRTGLGNDWVRIAGVKFIMDGSIGGHTAAIAEPYFNELHPHNCGNLYYKLEEVSPDITKAMKAGLSCCIHCIGERAIEMSLACIENAAAEGIDPGTLRIRFDHVALPTDDQIDRFKKFKIIISSSSAFMYHMGEAWYNAVGLERMARAFPNRKYLEKNIISSCNADCPVCDMNPMLGISAMVLRKAQDGRSFGEAQTIPVLEALKCYTINAAYSTFDEDKIGSLKIGKYADITVLNENILSVNSDQIKDIEVAMTIVDGSIVYKME